ncbi:protein kinase [Streptomyces sp. NPDC093085]|uniref:protein kinase n=1 Tax=Streptomyces sp. NPDC093085 TaxID=3155068 RepID=UPI003445E112
MDEYAGRVLADRYRLPLPPSDEYELVETRAFDTYSGQEVLVRQVPLPEVVEAEVVETDGGPPRRVHGRTARRHTDPAVRRAIEAAQSAAQIPDHPRLDQVFDVFAEAGSLWIVSELIAARPLAALLAERPLNPFRAAEIASDVLTAVRVVHAHGWTHRNITVRTVLVCDDGRVVLTGLAAGAAEEALCGYAPVPEPPDPDPEPVAGPYAQGRPEGHSPGQSQEPEQADEAPPHGLEGHAGTDGRLGSPGRLGLPEGFAPSGSGGVPGTTRQGPAYDPGPTVGVPGATGRAELERAPRDAPYDENASSGTSGAFPRPRTSPPGAPAPYGGRPSLPSGSASGDIRAARAGAIAAYRAGARAAAQASEEQTTGGTVIPPLPEPRSGSTSGAGGAGGAGVTGAGSAGTGTGGLSAGTGTGTAGTGAGEGAEGTEGADAGAGTGGVGTGTGTGTTTGTSTSTGSGISTGTGSADGGRPEEPVRPAGPDPDWWAQPRGFSFDPDGDADGDADEDEEPPTPYRPRLAGTWRDGPAPWSDTSGSLPAGGGLPGGDPAPYGGPGDEDPHHGTDLVMARSGGGRWDEVMASGTTPAYRGPATPLAAERARQARIALVGAVTERWSPEQAGPVHGNWQLAPPIGPATDLWALGALLYRAVQGHAPYPEESAIELVQLVCAEPPAFAEECGPLRPVVESLLRQDPTERPDFEELRGWLRSLIRSAPEPEAGLDVVPLLSEDATKLPIKRRRGELVRRRRRRDLRHGKHRQKKGGERKEKPAKPGKAGKAAASGTAMAAGTPLRGAADGLRPYEPREPRGSRDERGSLSPETEELFHQEDRFDEAPERAGRRDRRDRTDRRDRAGRAAREEWDERDEGGRGPRALGRTLLLLILLLVVGGIAYAMLFLPRNDAAQQGQSVSEESPGATSAPRTPSGESPPPEGPAGGADTTAPQTDGPPPELAQGYAIRQDTEGFRTAVDKTWQRSPINDSGQVRFNGGGFTLIVVPGRDSVADNGDDPLVYQSDKERELQPLRDSSWSSSTGVRRIDVGQQAMAEGQYTWQDSSGREVYVRNLAMIVAGRYHIVQVIGPEDQRDKVTEIYQQATGNYRVTR